MRINLSLHGRTDKNSPSLFGKVMLLGAALLAAGFSTQVHAQNYSVFNSILQQQGTPSDDGTQITYALVRQDLTGLTVKLYSSPATPAYAESVASGYIGLQQIGALSGSVGTYFVDASLPAEAKQLPVLESALIIAGFPITAITDEVAGISKTIYHVHFEGTVVSDQTVLATALATVVATINNPQLGLSIVYPGVVYSGVPAKFRRLVTNGVLRLIDGNSIVYSIPRNDAKEITLGGGTVPGTPSVGVGEQVSLTGDGASAMVNLELALTKNEVATVQQILLTAGYTLSGQSDFFTDESKKLTYLHAVATAQTQAQFYDLLSPLGDALLKIVKK